MEQIFSNIYREGVWGYNAEGKAHSGFGSRLHHARPYISFLEEFIRTQRITSVLDLGCGDWEFSQHIDWGGAHYVGIDIVKAVIENNQEKFPHVQFVHANFLECELPPANLLLCKDVLHHLPNTNVLQFLEKTKQFKYRMLTNDCDLFCEQNNGNCEIGGYRPLDLTQAPFCLAGERALTYYVGDTLKHVFLSCG